ncbi:hypothetical protein HK100_004741, partial [Physocladia obscura]
MMSELSRLLDDHVPGTRLWLLTNLMEFLKPENSGENRVLWLQGELGIGKSVMSALVARELRQRNLLGAVFFSKHDNKYRNNARCLITTIAFGLCEWSIYFAKFLLKLYNSDPDIVHKPTAELFNSLIRDPLIAFFAENPKFPPVVIVVDALDECGKLNFRKEILQVFYLHCKTLPAAVKIFVAARPDEDIADTFSQLKTTTLEASSQQNLSDAEKYARYFLLKNSAERDAVKSGPLILVKKSAGVFVWLVVACKLLEANLSGTITLKMIEDIDLVSKKDTTVDNLYFQILSRIFGVEHDDSSLLFHILATIICAFEPLSIGAISDLTTESIEAVKSATRALNGLLVFDIESKTIRIFHKSLKDYLTDPTRCKDPRFAVNLHSYHEVLAERTLQYLNKFLSFNICNLPLGTLHQEISNFSEILSEIPQAAIYSAENFHQHCLINLEPKLNAKLLQNLFDLFFQRAHHWIELMSLLGKTSQAIQSVTSILSFYSLQDEPEFESMRQMLRDIKRVLQRFFIPIHESALQIYATAVPLSPCESLFYRTYYKLRPNEIKVPLVVPQQINWQPCMNTLEGHKDYVNSIAISLDGKFIASGSSDNTVKIWDIQTGMVINTFEGHSGSVNSVSMSTDIIVSGSEDNLIKIWDTETGVLNCTLEGHNSPVLAVSISANGLFIVSGSRDNTVKVWNAKTGLIHVTIKAHDVSVLAVAISATASFIVSGSRDASVKIWNTQTGGLIGTFDGHTDHVNSVAISTDEKLIVSGSNDNTVKIWDVQKRKMHKTIKLYNSKIYTVAISANGKYIVSGSNDGSVRVLDAETGAVRMTFEGHNVPVFAVAFSTDEQCIISGSADKTLKIWDSQTSPACRTLEQSNSSVHAVAIALDENTIVLERDNGTQKMQFRADKHYGLVLTVAVSSDGQFVVSGSADWTLKIWDLKVGVLLKTLIGHQGSVNTVAISTDNRFIVSGSDDSRVKIWNLDSGAMLQTLSEHRCSVHAVAASKNWQLLASGSDDYSIVLWSTETFMAIKRLIGHENSVYTLAFCKSSQFVVSGSNDNTVKIWDIHMGEEVQTLHGHDDDVKTVAISTDRQFLVSGSYDNTLKICDLHTGEIVRTLQGHNDGVNTVAISVDGQFVVSGSNDSTLKIWDIQTGTILKTLEGHNSAVHSVAITEDGKHIISGSKDNSVKIWDIDVDEMYRMLKGHDDDVNAVAISAYGEFIVSGSDDTTLKVWSRYNGNVIQTLTGHSSSVNAVAVSADGRFIISGSADKTIKIWDAQTGIIIKTLEGHTDLVHVISVSEDGQFIVSGSHDNTVRIWDTKTGKVVRAHDVEIVDEKNSRIVQEINLMASKSTLGLLKDQSTKTGISVNQEWIRDNDRSICLWLPSDFRIDGTGISTNGLLFAS